MKILGDHDTLRKDPLWQTTSERTEALASCSTLCRLENRAGRKEARLMHEVLFEQFVGSFESAPNELILDFDCTEDRVHGLQEGRHFHGYYYDFCFLPLYVFCGEQL
jgi:Transposase DDE domain group 1